VTVEAVIAAGRSWIGTPYHHMARVKGHGVDCAQVLIAAFVEAEMVEDFNPGYYTMDWHLHRNEERYLSFMETYLERIDEGEDQRSVLERPLWVPPPASVIAIRVGRTFSHGALVTQWPNVIHANVHDGCVVETTVRGTVMETRPLRTYAHRSLIP
jgi:hypothetical protein